MSTRSCQIEQAVVEAPLRNRLGAVARELRHQLKSSRHLPELGGRHQLSALAQKFADVFGSGGLGDG
jgi:hypothetical protein